MKLTYNLSHFYVAFFSNFKRTVFNSRKKVFDSIFIINIFCGMSMLYLSYEEKVCLYDKKYEKKTKYVL